MTFALAGYGKEIMVARNRAGSAFCLRKSNIRADGKISSGLENPMKPYEKEIRSKARTAHAAIENSLGLNAPYSRSKSGISPAISSALENDGRRVNSTLISVASRK